MVPTLRPVGSLLRGSAMVRKVEKVIPMRSQVLLAIVTSSYLTLGIFDSRQAGDLWAPYAAVTFALAMFNLVKEWKSDHKTP